jgi:hypothetical protein
MENVNSQVSAFLTLKSEELQKNKKMNWNLTTSSSTWNFRSELEVHQIELEAEWRMLLAKAEANKLYKKLYDYASGYFTLSQDEKTELLSH